MPSASTTSLLTATARVSKVDGPVSADLNGEIAILDPASGTYFGLNEVGAVIWDFLVTERSFGEIVNTVVESYEVDPGACASDIHQLLTQLQDANLVRIDASAT